MKTADTVTAQPTSAFGEVVRRITVGVMLDANGTPDQFVFAGLLYGASLALASPEWFMGTFAATGAPLDLFERRIESARKFMAEFPVTATDAQEGETP